MLSSRFWRTFSAYAGAFAFGFCAVAVFTQFSGVTPGFAQSRKAEPKAERPRPVNPFSRPTYLPFPKDNPPTPEKIALGERLFHDRQLSVDGSVSCASCHDPRLSFSDGEPTGQGVGKQRLIRHTPSLWNLAWAPLLYWDGRAGSLELQAKFPIEHPQEMGENLDNLVKRLSDAGSYAADFAKAFPESPALTGETLLKARAAYERTQGSPPTRFDQWIAGDRNLLTVEERKGLELFSGRGRCIACHTGFAFTDYSFHDIGLKSQDLGRGPILGVDKINFAFKTPGLRELAWTAPYMHDGSMATLEDVIRHYETGGIDRPSRSTDLPRAFKLTDEDRAALVAFLMTLSSETAPKPSREDWVLQGRPPQPAKPVPPSNASTVSQRNRTFAPGHVAIKASQPLTILNDDIRTHNVRIFDPRMDFNSGAQDPGESVTLKFPEKGSFEAFCGIHPHMRLKIDVR